MLDFTEQYILHVLFWYLFIILFYILQ